MLNPKQMNIAHGPQGQRWSDDMIAADERWENQAERDLGPAYRVDVAKTHAGESSHYYPGQGGPDTQTQGKLFHDPKPSDPVRWPRGYTPERQSDVEVSLAPAQMFGQAQQQRTDILAARTRNTVARSSMPERDLSSVSKGFEDPIRVAPTMTSTGGGGSYNADQRQVNLGSRASANTVLHEMGHAVSDARKTVGTVGDERVAESWNQASDIGGTGFAKVAGAEEARADIYGNRHAKRMSGDPHLRTDDYDPSAYQYGGYDQHYTEAAFAQEYANEHLRQGEERPSEIGKKQQDTARTASRNEMLQSNARSDELLFRRHRRDSADTSLDYGQHSYRDYTGREEIGSIRSGRGVQLTDLQRRHPDER